MENNFKFIMPAELSKAEDGSWKIAGLASTESKDLQGEILLRSGLDLSPIDQNKGWLNFDHSSKLEDRLGTLDGYSITDKGLMVSGTLFKHVPKAQAVQQIMASLKEQGQIGRCGLSVEGVITGRSSTDSKIITGAKINAVAITFSPVNTDTYVDLVKSMSHSTLDFDSTSSPQNIIENLNLKPSEQPVFTASQVIDLLAKTLSVGSGYATEIPSQMSGGTALSMESLNKEPVDVSSKEEKKKKEKEENETIVLKSKMSSAMIKANMTLILDKISVLYPQYSKEILWAALKARLETKFPTIN